MKDRRAVSKFLSALLKASVALLAGAGTALACTTMALGPDDSRIVAYSYDHARAAAGWVVVNPVHVSRRSIMDGPPAEWTARFGSVTVNQFGPGMPMAGMNTEGLVVTLMWNRDVTYGRPGAAPRLNELELIQHLLDTAPNVDEALAAASRLTVDGMIPIHYFLQDRTGASASLRLHEGRAIVTRGADMPVPALSNTTYESLLRDVARFRPFGGSEALPSDDPDPDSLTRFAMAARTVERTAGGVTPAEAFAALEEVRNSETRWQVLFDPHTASVSYRTTRQPDVVELDIETLDFACRTAPLHLDLEDRTSAPVMDRLRQLDGTTHARQLEQAFGAFHQFDRFGDGFAAGVAEAQAASIRCPE